MGAAPATLFKCDNCGAKYPQRHNGWDTDRCIRCGRVTHQPDAPAAPAQPDARDAEIERLKEELEAATATIEDEQAAHEETRADAARLTKELEEGKTLYRDLFREHNKQERRADAAEAQAKAPREALNTGVNALLAARMTFAEAHRIAAIRDEREQRNAAILVAVAVLRRALAPPEPKAETPAETAGQKEGLTALQSRVAAWVRLAFGGAGLTDRWERAARVVEEAAELGQAEGLAAWDVLKILARVYGRPAGDVEQEAGGVMVCLLAWAAGRETSLAACALREIERIEQPATIEKIRRKQAEKAKAGTGHDFAPPSHPAQPSQDVAGTSGEAAGLSKEGSETP